VTVAGYDPDRARELVERVKARSGGRFAFTLIANESSEEAQAEQLLQGQWSKVGIDVTLQIYDQQAKIIHGVTGDFQASLQQNFDHTDPSNDCIFWMRDAQDNPRFSLTFARLWDDEETRACYDAIATTDAAARRDAFARVQRRIAALTPYVWLGRMPHIYVASTHLMNLVQHALPDGSPNLPFVQGSHALFQVWIDRSATGGAR
jgi:ABC-type transport system substrate-binding protein